MDYPTFTTLDEFEQVLADRKQWRLEGFITDVYLAAFARDAGAESIAAQYTGWTAQTIRRMAMLIDLPLELLDPELPLGVYWVAIQHTDSPEEAHELIRRAIDGRWSMADAKEALGIKSERTAAPRFKATLTRDDDGRIVLEPDETPSHWFERAEVREVAT